MNITIIATRISGNDGVSLEAEHWRRILTSMGHKVNFVAGVLDRRGTLIPELHFQSPKIAEIHDRVVYGAENYKKVQFDIFDVAGTIEGRLREIFSKNGKTQLLIVPNVLSLPVHFPLAVALTRVIEEFKIPTIARHHDFWWERKRFLKSSMFHFFKRWFPPQSSYISHVVINSQTREELKKRTGIEATIISDTFDFGSELDKVDNYARSFRKNFGIGKNDLVFLQATRIVPRKRIELAIDLIKKLNNPKAILLIAGKSGDEGMEYEEKIRELAKESEIRYKFIGEYVEHRRRVIYVEDEGKMVKRRIYSFWDCYRACDFVTYPTELEGFGNQFLEGVYFKKPIVVTPYSIYKSDIRPLGFDVIEMPNKGAEAKTITKINNLISDPTRLQKMVNTNFEIAKNNFDYEIVRGKIEKLMQELSITKS